MNETIIEWMKIMYRREIEETRGTIANYRMWALGDTRNGHDCFIYYISIMLEYIEILETKIAELDKLEETK